TTYFSSLFMSPRPPTSTLFPYTTLFRSRAGRRDLAVDAWTVPQTLSPHIWLRRRASAAVRVHRRVAVLPEELHAHARPFRHLWRSEEHTSELQSRFDLVRRLLLEKNNVI